MPQFRIHASQARRIMGIKGLGQTGKTLCEEWVKEQLYGRRKVFTSKYTEKGLQMEDAAIAFAAEYFSQPMSKNKTQYKDADLVGTPDVVTPDAVNDLKCSWDCFTFPLLDTEPERDYVIQLQIYMALTGKSNAGLIYTLMDAPENLIEQAARKEAYKIGLDELPAELYDEVRATMCYSHLPAEQRIKRFEITADPSMVLLIRSRVAECREYINSIHPSVLLASFDPSVNATIVV